MLCLKNCKQKVYDSKKNLEEIEEENIRLKKIEISKKYQDTKKYWRN